jgi:hypothetical protein
LVLNSPYLDKKLQQVAKILKDSGVFLLSHLGYSQTWLNLIANDRQFGYITNLEKEKETPDEATCSILCQKDSRARDCGE